MILGCGNTAIPPESPHDLLKWAIENCQYAEARQTLWSSIGVMTGSLGGATGVGTITSAALGEDSKGTAIALGTVAVVAGTLSALSNHLSSTYADAFKTRQCEDKYKKLSDTVLQ